MEVAEKIEVDPCNKTPGKGGATIIEYPSPHMRPCGIKEDLKENHGVT